MELNVSIRKNNVISVVDPETMDIDTTHQLFDIVEKHARELRHRGEHIHILVDVRQVKHDGEQVRKVMFQRGRKLDFDRLAIVGANTLQTKSINMLLLAAQILRTEHSIEKIKFFKDERSAELWLANSATN